jgi:hypothetical protein
MVLAGLAHIVPPTRSPRTPDPRRACGARDLACLEHPTYAHHTPLVTDRGTAFMSSVLTSNGAELRAKRTVVAPNLS